MDPFFACTDRPCMESKGSSTSLPKPNPQELRSHNAGCIDAMLCRFSLVVLTLATIILVGTFTMPIHALAVPGQAIPPGMAEFSILDFTQTQVTWSLKVSINGNHTSDILAIRTGSDTIFEYYAQYDRNVDATIIKKTYVSQFTSISGQFPNEQWILQMLFAVNASLTNLPTGDSAMQLPTINYDGVLFISSSQSQGVSDIARYGSVYSLVAYLSRNPGVARQLESSMVTFPSVLSYLSWILLVVVPIDLVFFLLRIDPSWRIYERRPIWFARYIAQCYPQLLNGKYFAIIVGILFFLPIYGVSLHSLEAPIPITQGDLTLIQLMTFYAWTLLASFLVSLVTSKRRQILC